MPFVPDKKIGFIPDASEGEYQPSPVETGLAAMAPKGLVSAIAGLRDAVPVGMEKGFDEGLSTYRRSRDQARADLESSEQLNPRSAMVGGIAPYIPVATAGIPSAMALGGATSAIDSKADLTRLNDPAQRQRLGQDVGMGMALGGIFGAAGRYAPKSTAAAATGAMAGSLVSPENGALPGAAVGLAARGAASPVVRSYLMKKFNNTLLDVPETVSDRYMKNPKKVMAADSPEGVAQKIADTFGDIRSDIGGLNQTAQSTLSSDRAKGIMRVNEAVSILSQFDDPKAKQMADDIMSGYLSRSGGVSPHPNADQMTEIEVHKVKKFLQGLGEWNSALPSSDKAQANFVSGQVNRVLKAGNPDYSAAMEDLSKGINVRNQLAGKFGISRDLNDPTRFTYSDRTLSAMKDVVRANKVDRVRILNELREQGYGDIADEIQDSLAKQLLSGGGNTQGSRKAVIGGNVGTALGAGIGGMFGGPIGAGVGAFAGRAAGSVAGGAADKYGPRLARRAMDANSVINRVQSKLGNSKFIAPLKAAAERGDQSFASTYFLMHAAEPDFRRAMENED